jgi:acylphosphatase
MKQAGAPNGDRLARLEIRAHGIVQGVGFRYWLRREALRLGVTGWVANQADGSIEVVAEGPAGALERLTEVASVGPPGAAVRNVDVRWGAPTGEFEGFAIRAGSHPGD